jgi:hypothetical protein
MLADADRVRHDRERRVHGGARREETAVNHVQVIDVVGLTERVQGRRPPAPVPMMMMS